MHPKGWREAKGGWYTFKSCFDICTVVDMISPYSNSNDCYACACMHAYFSGLWKKAIWKCTIATYSRAGGPYCSPVPPYWRSGRPLYEACGPFGQLHACNLTLPALHGSQLTMHDLPCRRSSFERQQEASVRIYIESLLPGWTRKDYVHPQKNNGVWLWMKTAGY